MTCTLFNLVKHKNVTIILIHAYKYVPICMHMCVYVCMPQTQKKVKTVRPLKDVILW